MTFKLLLLYIITLPLMKTPNLPFLAQKIQFSEVVFLFLFFFWMKDLIKSKRLPQDTGLNKPFLIFLIFCILSFFNSANLFLSTIELAGLIYLFVMLILTVDIVDEKKKIDLTVKIWISTLFGVLVLGFIGLCLSIITGKSNLFCQAFLENFPYINICYRPVSTFRLPQSLGNYLMVSLGFVISDFLLTKNKHYKLFLKIIIFSMCLIVLSTVSKSILSFSLVFYLIYSYFNKIKTFKFRVIQFLLITIIIVSFVISIFCSTFYIRSFKVENISKKENKELAINVDYAYDVRMALKTAAFEMTKRHPFLGVGLATFPLYAQKLNEERYLYFRDLIPIYVYVYKDKYIDYLPYHDPHNDFLQYFAEIGILGGSAFILFIATFLYLIFFYLKKVKDDGYFKVRLFCLFASFIGMLLDSIDVDVFKLRYLWFLMGIILALIMMYKNKINVTGQ